MSDIDTEVAHRRARLGDAALTGSSHKWGLALSGGGIRSATFCFGLLSALARQGALLRFDLLSTVSGGGYIGAMLGRLFGRAQSRADLDRIQNEIAGSDSSWFVWWLRANGRYLIPRGALDRTLAVALYLRNLAGVHLELGLMSVLVGLALTALNLAVWQGMAMLGYQTWPSEYFRWAVWLPKWLPVSWLFLPVVALFAGVYASAYWAVPWVQPTRRNGAVWVVCLGVLVASAGLLWLFWLYGRPGSETGSSVRDVLWSGFGVFVVVWVLGVRTASTSLVQTGDPEPTPLQADKARNRLTRRLAVCFRVFIVIVAVGAADRMAWYLAFDAQRLVSVGVYLAMAAAVLRAVLPLASNLVPGRNSAKSLMAVGHILGFMLAFLLFAWWVSLVHKSVLGAMFFGRTLAFSSAWIVWALFLAPVLGYIVLTGRNLAFLNLSSLHSFYRARLIRGYLGAANGERFGSSDALGALDRVPAALPVTLDTASVNKVWLGDDVSLEAYRPQDAGGPVHLINVCVNQTKDPRGQLFNQDRRGLPLTVASGGQMQVSQDGWTPLKGQASMTLGTWTAISGAAVAPGLGSLTRGGIAALATFAGLRLGYWWSKAERTNQPDKKGVGFLAKSSGLLDEMLAVFKGKEGPDWFLTDGGHFENTGAYALLAERTEVVVVADCGADPDYAFGDIENLVRKARIDLQAEIQFQRPRHAPESDTPDPHQPESPFQRKLKAFGSLQQLASNASNACLALAKITYGGADKGQGILIVIKPNMCRGLPIDLQNFKKQSPDFPQETTADQFFSEAQWEGYFLLGQILGKELDQLFIEALLEDCNKDAPEYFVYDDCSVEMSATGADGQNGKKAPEGRLIGSVTAVGASIGLGAAATLGVSAWQAIDSVKESRAKQISNERAALDEITKLWAALPPKDSADFHSTDRATSRGLVDSFGKLAGALVRTADTLCPAREADWFNQSVLARRISRDAVEGCGALPAGTRSQACDVLVEAANPNLRGQLPACLSWAAAKKTALPPPRYWAYDYSNWARVDDMHPCSPFRVQLLQDEATHEKDFGRLSDPQSRSEFADDDDKKGDKVEKPCPNPAWKGSVNSDREKLGLPPISPDVATLPPPPPPPPPAPAPAPAPAAPPAPPPPVAAPSPAAEPGPTEAGKRVIAEGQDRCRGITVYVQVYDGTQRAIARDYREPWRTLGASVPPIEDVTESARKSGRPVPQSISRTTVRFHDQASIGCAVVLGPVVGFDGWAVEALSPNLKAANRTIEVWIASPKK